MKGVYQVECVGADGVVKWIDAIENLVTNQGKDGMLDTYFAGSAYTATWYMSLFTAGAAVAGSVYTSPGVTEIGAGVVSGNTRPTIGWSAAANGAKSATTTTFSATGTASVIGAMVVTGGSGASTVANTTATGGILFSAGTFAVGVKNISNGDTLNVTYSISI